MIHESRHKKVRDWLANNIPELEGAAALVGKEVGAPFVNNKE